MLARGAASIPALALVFSLLSLPAVPALALPTVIEVDGSSSDWGFLPEGGSPIGYFAVGPSGQPYGLDSALLATDESADGLALISQELIGTRLEDFLALSYWTHVDVAPQAPALQFSVDYDAAEADDTNWQGRLVFEPTNAASGTVTADTWQQWDALAGEWWATGEPGKTECPQSDPCTWAEILTAFPDAAIHGPTLGQLLVKAGSGWSGSHTTYVDGLRVETTGGVDVVYDFETTSARVNTSELSENGWFADDTRADGTATLPEAAGTDLVSPTLTDQPEALSGSASASHDDDIRNQIDFLLFGPPVEPPAGEWPGAVHLQIADGVTSAKSQISHRNNPDIAADADGGGFGYGHEILTPIFQARYSWLSQNLDNTALTGALKLGFQTTEYPGANLSSRTGEDAWDKLLVYEPSNGNGGASDGTWQSETVLYSTGKWWIVDRVGGIATTQGQPMTLAEMEGSATSIGARTVGDVWDLLVDVDPGEEAILTSIQFGVGSNNPGASVYLNQIETSFYRKGMVTTFGHDPADSAVICVPSQFDPRCEGSEPTLQDALDLADLEPQDVILVAPGNYIGSFVAPTGVQIVGAGEGVSGCGRSISESTIFGSLRVDAPNTVVEGFTFAQGPAKLTTGGPVDELVVRNNRFLGGEEHVVIDDGGSDVTVEDNEFTGDPPNAPEVVGTAAQLMVRADLPGLYVARNCFSTSDWPAVAVEGATVAPSGLRPPVLMSNTVEATGGGVDASIGKLEQVEISGNTFTDFGAFGLRGQLRSSLVFDNLFRDGTGDGVEISENQATASPGNASTNNSVLLNCFFQNTGSGVVFSAGQAAGTIASNFARFNDFAANGAGVTYVGAEAIDVSSNYWGAADGPSGDGPGSGDAVDGPSLDFDPFLPEPSTFGTPCNPEADLVISKQDDVDGLAVPGQAVTYTIRVENLGPFDATAVTVADDIPDGLDACTWTCQSEGAAACGVGAGSDDIADLANVPVGDAVVYELSCTLDPAAVQVTNTATVTAGGEDDPDLSNNEDATVLHTVDAIFSDGFESGDVSAWTSSQPEI